MILSTRFYKSKGFVIIKESITDYGDPFEMRCAYSYPDLYYIGLSKQGFMYNRKFGISEFYPTHDYKPTENLSIFEKAKKLLLNEDILNLKKEPACSIGWSPRDQKWYGWSHRALYGFTIGSETKKGDCGFRAANKEDDIESFLNFWDFNKDGEDIRKYTDQDENVIGQKLISLDYDVKDIDFGDQLGIRIKYETYVKDDRKVVQFSHFHPYPEQYGRGEWVARTLDDAKQMAIDFADGVD